MSDEVRNQETLQTPQFDLSWLIAARLCFLSVALGVVSAGESFFPLLFWSNVSALYTPLAFLFGFCVFSAFWIKRHKIGLVFSFGQLFIDVGIISGVIYLTGGPLSPFVFLYLPLIMATSVLLSRNVAIALSGVIFVAYTALVLGLSYGWFGAFDGGPGVGISMTRFVVQCAGLVGAMLVTAFGTAQLMRRLRWSHALVNQSLQNLAELDTQQKALIEGLGQGVFRLDASGCIQNSNKPGAELLGLSSERVIGTNFWSNLKTSDNNSLLRRLRERFECGLSFEEEICLINVSEGERRVRLRCSAILNQNSEWAGSLIILEDVTRLRLVEEQLANQERMARLMAQSQKQDPSSPAQFESLVGDSPIMQKIGTLIHKVADSDATVLIGGESGTGKELVAKAIHTSGIWSNGPFVAVNCGAIPENLIESELFGHKRGAFTGATVDHLGLFRQAEGGTIFLDEIGELPLAMQPKLLRAIQERKVRPVGGDRDILINVRVIAATNRNLKHEIEAGRFREDLFYRLNVINIQLPALREHKEDLPPLINSILASLTSSGVTPLVTPVTLALLMNYDYPGNVRELENILERALVLGGEVVLPEHLPENVRSYNPALANPPRTETGVFVDESQSFPVKLDEILDKVERKYLEAALLETSGAKKKAAELLGINFRSFRYRLQKFGISEDEPNPQGQNLS